MTFCVFCGSTLSDPTRCESCGAYELHAAWHQGVAPNVEAGTTDTGWRPDPTGRHEGRYFVSGQPTDLIRDGGAEAVDPVGKEQLNQASSVVRPKAQDSDGTTRVRRRLWWVIAAVVLALVLIGAGVGTTLYLKRDRLTADDKYLAALRASEFSGEFNSDANAVAHGKQVCRTLEDGAPQQGLPADEIAVSYYCPQFSEGFHVLETITVNGSISLKDDSPNYYSPSISVSGSSCSGSGGYSDIDQGTQVIVKNGKGDILTTTVLEQGTGGIYQCSFPFSFDIKEGEDRYIVTVSHRGDMSYSFGDLKGSGVALVLGGH